MKAKASSAAIEEHFDANRDGEHTSILRNTIIKKRNLAVQKSSRKVLKI